MMKKNMMIMLVVCLAVNAFATDYWASPATGSWYSPDGVAVTAWGGVLNPWFGDAAYLSHGATVTYDGANSDALSLGGAWVSTTNVGSWSDYDLVAGFPDQDTLDLVNGAALYQDGWAYVGTAGGDIGVVNIDATSLWQSTSVINIGYNGSGEVNVYGDLVAEFNGSAGGLFIDNPWSGETTGSGALNVYDGAWVSAWAELGPNGLINIEQGGVISLAGTYWGTSWTDYLSPLIGTQLNVIGAGTISIAEVDGITQVTAVPEPATMCLLGFGGLMALKRRRS